MTTGNWGAPFKWACTVLVGLCALVILLILPSPSRAANEVITATPSGTLPATGSASLSPSSTSLPTGTATVAQSGSTQQPAGTVRSTPTATSTSTPVSTSTPPPSPTPARTSSPVLTSTPTPGPTKSAASPLGRTSQLGSGVAVNWPQFRFDLPHTGFNPFETVLSTSTVGGLVPRWAGGTGNSIESSPAVANGVVYVGSDDSKLYAFDAAGNTNCGTPPNICFPLWTATTGGVVKSSPAVANGVVYVGSFDHNLYAFDAAGSINCAGTPKVCGALWTATTGGVVESSPAVANGEVYVGSDDNKLYAFDAAGSINCAGTPKVCSALWTATTGGIVFSSPAVANGVVYVGSFDHNLYAFDAAGNINCAGTPKVCSPLWTATTGGGVFSSPAVANGEVYVGSLDNKLYAFDAAGSINCAGTPRSCSPLWSATIGGEVSSSPAVANGEVYVGSLDSKLYTFDAAGSTNCAGTPKVCSALWTATTGGIVGSSPAVANGVAYVGSFDHNLYAFDAAGNINCAGTPKVCGALWTATTGASIQSSPTVANGEVYVGSDDNKLYAFGPVTDYRFNVNSPTDADNVVLEGNCLSGTGPCTLRAALQKANSLGVGNNYAIGLPPGTYTLTLGSPLSIAISGSTMSINGGDPLSTIVDGNNTTQVFNVTSGNVALNGVTVQNGRTTSAGGGIRTNFSATTSVSNSIVGDNSAGAGGGGISNDGTMTLTNSTISDNNVNSGVDGGGGINNAGGSMTLINTTVSGNTVGPGCSGSSCTGGGIYNFGTLTLTDSTISNNQASSPIGSDGGGIRNVSMLFVTDSTISGNTANRNGGGLYSSNRATVTGSTITGNIANFGGGVVNDNMFTLTNSTVSGNTASAGGGGLSTAGGGTSNLSYSTVAFNDTGINSSGAITNLSGTIIADSTAGANCTGTTTDQGFNLSSDGSCGFSVANHSLPNTDPLLAALADNGGPTQTMALQAGSPAIGAGGTACPPTDQRGAARPSSGCDIGAVELTVPRLPLPIVNLTSPVRGVDTRTGLGGFTGQLTPGSDRCFTLGGLNGVPSDAAGVVVNLTAVGQTSIGWLTLYPDGQALPPTSTLNFDPDQYAIANGAIVRLGSNNQVCVDAGNSPANAVIDVTGYLPSAGSISLTLLPNPVRAVDTRSGIGGFTGPIEPGVDPCYTIAGVLGIPADATGLVLNVTGTGYTSNGWLTVYPSDEALPSTSTANFDTHEYAIANNALMKVGTSGDVCVDAGQSASHVILDVVGYVTSTGQTQVPLTAPSRAVDTRVGIGGYTGQVAPGADHCFTLAGVVGVPASASAVIVNVAAVGYSANGWLTLYPNGQALPATSTTNFDVREYAIANGAIMRIGTNGKLCVDAGLSPSFVIIDVTGYEP